MGFGSAIFLFGFLPLTVVLFHLLPRSRGRQVLLVAASLVFYLFGRLWDLPILLVSVLLHYAAGLLLRKLERCRRAVVAGTVALDLVLLVTCKYLGFFAESAGTLLGITLRVPALPLPLGISFFTFQGISYVVDAYRDRDQASGRFFPVLQYLTFFPNLVSGPLVPFRQLAPMLDRLERPDSVRTAAALRRFTVGLAKKLLLAGTLQTLTDAMFGLDAAGLDFRTAWLGAVSYSLQLYLDFSGYTDMAVGLGQLFGVRLPENFRYPYRAASITDFWRRWHMTLSGWFREYLYIPLGGNRRGFVRTLRNKLLVFLATGLWHGANWTFLVWGLWHGVFSMLETRRSRAPRRRRWYGHVYTLLVVVIGFVIFRADTLQQGLTMVRAMVTGFSWQPASTLALVQYGTNQAWAALLAGLVVAVNPFAGWWQRCTADGRCVTGSYVVTLALLLLCMLAVANGSFQPFLYQQF